MEKKNFFADKITYEINADEGYYMIGFSDNGDDPDQYVVAQRAVASDEQDAELGMDTYYFEYAGQSEYGVCKDVRLENNKLIFSLEENVFDNIGAIEIFFNQDDVIADWSEFKRIVNYIFN